MFSGKDTQMDNTNRLKEGSLKKESRHRKVWRERWVVLTEAIDVKTIKTVKTDESKAGFNFVSNNII